MGYPSYTNPKFPIDYIVGDYYEHDATPAPLGVGETVTIVGSLPDGLTYDAGDNKIKGSATTVADTDITVQVYNGPTLISSYPYTIVVLEFDITFSGPSSFGVYTVRSDTFGYSVTGSYTVDDPFFTDAGSVLPEGLILTTGTTASFSSYAKEANNFKAVLTFSTAAGHSYTKEILFTTVAFTASGSQLPTLQGTTTVAPLSGQFSQTYTAIEGNKNYSFYADLQGSMNVLTGFFSKNPTTGYAVAVADKLYSRGISDLPTPEEVVDIVAGPAITPREERAAPNIMSFLSSYDGTDYRLYASLFGGAPVYCLTAANRIWAIADRQDNTSTDTKKTSMYYVDGFVADGDPDYNDWVIHEINETTKAETNTKTVLLKNATTVNGLARSRTGKMLLLTNFNNDSVNCSPPQVYAPDTNTITATSLPANKNYVSAAYGTLSGTEYAYILNVTDSSLVRYKISDDTYTTYAITGGQFDGTCSRDKVLLFFDDFNNTNYILVTDSGADVIYRSTLSGTITTWKTLTAGAKPSGLATDNRIVYVLQQGFNNILSLDKDGTVINTTNVNMWFNRVALDAAPQTTITYKARGPVKPGSVAIEFATTDLGRITSVDDGLGVILGVAGASNGTINYCDGTVVVNYPLTTVTSSTPYISYESSPNSIVMYSDKTTENFRTHMIHNSIISNLTNQISKIQTVTVAGGVMDHISTTEIVADTITPVSDIVAITWGVGTTAPSDSTILSGTVPPGLTLTYPNVDRAHFKLSGTCTTPGVYVFTLRVRCTEPA